MSGSDWILVALAVLVLFLVVYLVVFGWWLHKYGGPRQLQAELRKRLSR